MMMRQTEVCEVEMCGIAAELPVDGVVDFASASGTTASGEPASFIAEDQPPPEVFGYGVASAAHRENDATFWMGEDSLKAGCAGGKLPGRFGINGPVALEFSGGL